VHFFGYTTAPTNIYERERRMIDHQKINPLPSRRFNISLPENLVKAVDRQAKAYYTTRSGLIRDALMNYLLAKDGKLGDEDELFIDPEEVFRIMRNRKADAYLKKILRERRYRKRQQR
jgi:hypothetical protein